MCVADSSGVRMVSILDLYLAYIPIARIVEPADYGDTGRILRVGKAVMNRVDPLGTNGVWKVFRGWAWRLDDFNCVPRRSASCSLSACNFLKWKFIARNYEDC